MCLKFGLNPDKLVALARQKPERVAKLVQEFADGFNSKGSVKYANHIIYLARTIFEVNGVQLKLHGFYQPTRRRKRREYVPSLADALKMADAVGGRDRVIILFMAYSGLRNSDVRALVYNEALPDPWLQDYTIKKQLAKGEECIAIAVHEIMKNRVPTACKNRIFYYTFIPPKVTEWLRLYLRDIEDKHGPIHDDQPLFPTQNREIPLRKRLKTPISARELQQIVKKAAKKAGLEHWKLVTPHCLRKTFDSFLREQPSEVRLDIKEREFLMGHILGGSQDAYFDKMKIEEMRTKYAKMVFEPAGKPKTEKRLVGEDDLPTLLEQGWQPMMVLPSGKVVVARETVMEQLGADKAQVSSNTNAQKGNLHPDSKSPISEGSSLVNYQVSGYQPIQPNISNEYDKTSEKETQQYGLQQWINPSRSEPPPTPEPSFSVAVEEKEYVTRPAPGNKVAKTNQRRLLDFCT
jgi:integrase